MSAVAFSFQLETCNFLAELISYLGEKTKLVNMFKVSSQLAHVFGIPTLLTRPSDLAFRSALLQAEALRLL